MRATKTILTWTIAALLIAPIAVPTAMAADKKQSQKTDQLVWPLPPDKPRYRWLEMFSDVKQYESKKFAFIDRLTGTNNGGREVMMRPIGVATDSKDRVIVTSQTNRTVYVIDKNQKQVLRIQGSQSMPFKTPIGVATDDKD